MCILIHIYSNCICMQFYKIALDKVVAVRFYCSTLPCIFLFSFKNHKGISRYIIYVFVLFIPSYLTLLYPIVLQIDDHNHHDAAIESKKFSSPCGEYSMNMFVFIISSITKKSSSHIYISLCML